MYFPEANVLVPRDCDPASKTPAFKNVLVTLEALSRSLSAAGRQASTAVELAGKGSTRGDMRAC